MFSKQPVLMHCIYFNCAFIFLIDCFLPASNIIKAIEDVIAIITDVGKLPFICRNPMPDDIEL